MKKFFLLTRGRTGSTAVIDELNRSKGLRVASELFLVYDFKNKSQKLLPFVLWKTKHPGADSMTDEQLAEAYLAETEKNAGESSAQWFGFKVLSHHFKQWPFLNDILKKRDYHSIYLKRNIARQVLSGMVANQSGIFNTQKEVKELGTFHIDPIDFESRIRYQEKVVDQDCKKLEENGYDFIVVTYEEYCNSRQSFFEKVFTFLGMPMEMPPRSSFNVVIKDLKKTIENYGEVEKIFEKTGWSIND